MVRINDGTQQSQGTERKIKPKMFKQGWPLASESFWLSLRHIKHRKMSIMFIYLSGRQNRQTSELRCSSALQFNYSLPGQASHIIQGVKSTLANHSGKEHFIVFLSSVLTNTISFLCLLYSRLNSTKSFNLFLLVKFSRSLVILTFSPKAVSPVFVHLHKFTQTLYKKFSMGLTSTKWNSYVLHLKNNTIIQFLYSSMIFLYYTVKKY